MSRYCWWVDEHSGRVHIEYPTPISHEEKIAKLARRKKRKAFKEARKKQRRHR